jgi:hypothetical protein
MTRRILAITRKDATCRRLMSAPGVGPIAALAFRATIDDPTRFAKSRAVGAHLGLTPARHQAGETDIQGRISRCGDELAHTALHEAAHTLLVRSTKWSSLRARGMAVTKRRDMARARLAFGGASIHRIDASSASPRKFAVILHPMGARRPTSASAQIPPPEREPKGRPARDPDLRARPREPRSFPWGRGELRSRREPRPRRPMPPTP